MLPGSTSCYNRCQEVPGGNRWCQMIPCGAKWCQVVLGGSGYTMWWQVMPGGTRWSRWYQVVPDGATKPAPTAGLFADLFLF